MINSIISPEKNPRGTNFSSILLINKEMDEFSGDLIILYDPKSEYAVVLHDAVDRFPIGYRYKIDINKFCIYNGDIILNNTLKEDNEEETEAGIDEGLSEEL